MDYNFRSQVQDVQVNLRSCFWLIFCADRFSYSILDKSFESAFGLIAVLPGAFSAYRYAAVANFPDGTGPLQSCESSPVLAGKVPGDLDYSNIGV